MIRRRVAIIIFYDDKHFLIQDRKKISKHGVDFGFFGGGIEEGENEEQALRREIKEELGINIKNYKFFKHDIISVKEVDGEIERFVFIAPIPDITESEVKEGKAVMMNFEDSFNLKMVSGDVKLLKEIYESLRK